MSVDGFVEVCDRLTNKKIFKRDARGNLIKDRHGNLTKVNYDNEEPPLTMTEVAARRASEDKTHTVSP